MLLLKKQGTMSCLYYIPNNDCVNILLYGIYFFLYKSKTPSFDHLVGTTLLSRTVAS